MLSKFVFFSEIHIIHLNNILTHVRLSVYKYTYYFIRLLNRNDKIKIYNTSYQLQSNRVENYTHVGCTLPILRESQYHLYVYSPKL